MKKTDNVKNSDIDFLEVFKKSLALSFTVFLFGVQQSYANNNITPGGNYGTQIEGGNTNNTTITGGTINNGTGFHHFDQFQVGQGGTANLIFAENADRYVNLVNNQVSIYGIFNSLKNGQIGGNVIFVSPMGLILGSSGVMNVGSLQTITPSQSEYNRILGTTNLNDITSLQSNSTTSSTRIDGKIFAKDSININDGRSVTINKNADIIAGFNENGFAKTQLQGFKMSDIVNTEGIVDSAYMTDGAGSINIVANNVNTSGVSDGTAHIIQSSGDITIDTPKVGDIGVITTGSKIYAHGNLNIGNDAAESGTGTVLIEQDIKADKDINLKAMANIAQEANVTAGKDINIHAAIYNQEKETTTATNNGTIKIDGAQSLGKVVNKNGNIDIIAAVNSDLTFQDTVSAENGNISVSSTSGNILQSDDSFDAIKTQNGGKLSIRTYGPSKSIGTEDQALNLDVDGAVDISSVRGVSHLKSNNSTLTLGNISGVSSLNAQSQKDITIKDNIEVNGQISLNAQEGINQQAGSITSTGTGEIDIINGSTGAINVGNITNYDGGINIENQAAGEKLTISQRLEATGDINITSNAGIEQTDSSYISSTINGDITMTNKTEGDLIVGNISATNGEININNTAENGSVNLKQNISSVKDINISSKGGITQQAGSSISLNGANADLNIANKGQGDVSLSNISNTNGNVIIKNSIDETTDPSLAGDVILGGNITADLGYVDISSGNNIEQTGSITANGANSSSQSVIISAEKNANLNAITGKNNIQINADSVTLNNLIKSTESNINITTINDITQTGTNKTLDAKGNITLSSENGDIGKIDSDSGIDQGILLNSEGTVSLSGANINVSSPDKDVTFGQVTGSENVKLSTTSSSAPVPGGKITLTENVTGSKISINSIKDIDINKDVNSIDGIEITSQGGINQNETSTITNNGAGDIKLSNTNTGNINTGVITNTNGNIEITNTASSAEDSGKTNLNGLLTANAGNVTISSQSDIVQNESLEKAIIASGNVSLESLDGSIGNASRFITMQTPSPISAKAAQGSVYLKAIDSDLKFTDDSEIVFGKDIGLASNQTVVIEKTDGITANNGSIYIDSNGLFTLDKDLTAKNYIEIKGANGIDLQSNSTLTTTGSGDGIGNINIINAGETSAQGKGVVNINNINSTGKITIKSDNLRADSNKLTINKNATINATKGIDITSNTGITQNAGSTITNTESGDITITNKLTNELDVEKVTNKNGNISITNSSSKGIINFNNEVNAQNGDITVQSNAYIVQNSVDAILKAGNDINLSSNYDTGSTSTNGALKVNSGGTVNATGRNIYLESPDMDINTGVITASKDVNIKTTGTTGSVNATNTITGQNVVINAIDSIMQDEALDLAINATNNINLKAQNGNIGSSTGSGDAPNSLDVAAAGTVTASASKGEININSVNKNITFGNIVSAGDINLSSTGTNGQITTNSALQTDNGSINIDSSKNIILNNKVSASKDINLKAQTGVKHNAGDMTAAAGNINITNTTSGDVILKNVTATDGNITISAENSTGDISLTGKLSALSSDDSKGFVNINSGRHISQTGADSGISAQNGINLTSKTGNIGKSDTDNIKINIENENGLFTAEAENGSIYAQTTDKNFNLGTISAKNNISLKTTGSTGNINIKDTITGGNIVLNSIEDIVQESDDTSLYATGNITLNAAGNVGSKIDSDINTIKVSADGNVLGNAQNIYIESSEKDLKTGVITANNDLYLKASGVDTSVILNGLAKANSVEIIADKNIQQNESLEKAIESTTDVSLTALKGNIGDPKTENKPANAIDLSAGGRITASAAQGSVIINGVESDIQTDNITALKDIDLTTTNSGKITVTNDLITNTGYIRLDSAEDLEIANTIQAQGDVILGAADGINQTSGSISSTGNGNITITNTDYNDISLKNVSTANGDINIKNDAINANVMLNDTITAGTNGTITIGSQGNIEQTIDTASLISSGDITLNAKGNVGKLDGEDVKFIKVSTDGKVSGAGQKFYIESTDKDLKTGNINATDDVILKATSSDKSVKLNGLVKGKEVSIFADNNIQQDSSLEKSIEATTDVILIAQHGDIGEAATEDTVANAIDLTAGGSIAASAADGSVIINGVNSDIVTDNITAKNNIDLSTTQSGKITVSNDLVTNTGYISLNSAEDLEIANNITANGNVILIAHNGITQTDGLIQSSADGKVTIQNYNAGNISVKDVLSKSGGIEIANKATTGGNVIFNTTISTTDNGNIYIEANKDIIQNFVGDAISAGADVQLVSITGDIGKSDNYISLKVLPTNKVDATATQGSVNLNSTAQDIHFGSVEAGQNINLSTTESGKIYLDNDLTTNGGNISLDSAQDLAIQKNITASGNIKLNANGGIVQTDGNVTSTENGSITVTNNNSGDISLKKLTTNNGNIDITNNSTDSDVILNDEIKTNNKADINITSQGNIIQTGDNVVLNSDGEINLNAQKNIGLFDRFLNIFTRDEGKVNAQAENIYIGSTDKDIKTGNLSAINDVNVTTQGASGSIISENDITAGNAINLDSIVNITTKGATSAQNITYNAVGDINANNIDAQNSINLTATNITTTGQISGPNILYDASSKIQADGLVIGDDIEMQSEGDIITQAVTGKNDVIINAQNNINTQGKITSSEGNVNLTTTSGDITTSSIDAAISTNLTSGNDIITNDTISAQNVNLDAANNATTQIINSVNDVIINAQNNINAQGKITSSEGNVNLTTTSGDITTSSIDAAISANLTSGNDIITNDTISAQNADLNATGNVQTDGSILADIINIDANKNITTNNLITGNNISFTAGENITSNELITGDDVIFTANETITAKDILAQNNVVFSANDINSTGRVQASNIDFDATNSITINGSHEANTITFDTLNGDITANNNVTAKNTLTITSGKGINQTQDSIFTISENGDMTITSQNGDLTLAGSLKNNDGNINITNNSSGNNSLTVNNLETNGDFSIINNADGLLNLTGTIENASQNAMITANNTGANSGIVTSGTINNSGSIEITNKGQQGTQLGGNINNNLIEATDSNQSKVTVNNTNGGLNITAEIINGINKNSKNEIYLVNSGANGLNFASEGVIDNHGILNVENTSGNMSLWGTLKARLKSQNNFTNTGITGSADDDVIIGLKLENWGNEITYENTGAGSLIVHEDAVLSNFSVEDNEGVHTGVLNLKNSGNDGLAGGGIEINGTINNGIISDGTIVGEDNQLIPEGQIVSGGIVNIENYGTGVKVDSETIPSQRQDDFGIEINNTAKINNFAEMNIVNKNENSLGKIKIDGIITGDKGTIISGTPAQGSAPIPIGNVINITNNSTQNDSGIIFTSNSKTDVNGNTLNINNSGYQGISFEKGSTVNSNADINISNQNGNLKFYGSVEGENIKITNTDSDIIIGHNIESGNIKANNDININATNGSILNAADSDSLENAIGIAAGNNINMSADNIGKLDSTLNDIINQGFNLDSNNSIHITANGNVVLNSNNDLNIKGIDKDLNITSLTAKDAILSTNNGSINSSKSTTENLYAYAQGNNSEINLDNLTNTGKISTESNGNTTINSTADLNIETMLSNNGSINIESDGNTYIKEIAAPQDITIKVNDEKLSIETLGRVKRNQDIAPSTVNLTVLDAKREPSTITPKPGMNPDELEQVTPNSKLDILHAYVKDKVTMKADTITAQAYDISDTSQKGDKRIDSDGNAATGFHNANTEGKLLEFDIQGANYAQNDVSDISDNKNYVPDKDDKKALNVHLTLGDSVGDALYGANFKKLYADYAFIDSINNSKPDAISHIIVESGIIGEKAIIRNNNLRLDINNTDVVFNYPINKHYDDSPNETVNYKGSFNLDMYDKIDINKGPIDVSEFYNYNPNRIVKDPDLEKMTEAPSAKAKDNSAVKSERSTGFREINWTIRNTKDEIIGTSETMHDPIVTGLVGISEKSILVTANNELKQDQTVHVSLSYKDVPFNVDGKVKRLPQKELAEIEFINIDKLTSTIMLFVSMYQENL